MWKRNLSGVIRYLLFLILVLACQNVAFTWGFRAHRFINLHAIESLPTPLFQFYSEFASYVEEHAVDPDKRRYTDTNEAAKHYIDLEHFERTLPIDTIPHFWKDAIEQYGNQHLQNFGSLPWQIQWSMHLLKKAFQQANIQQILQISAELGHYVADAHVPLHTTENYDGQLTHQRGIHALWETKIPDVSLDRYRLIIPKAQFWYSEGDTIFKTIEESHQRIATILLAEKWINQQIPAQERYAIKTSENNGKVIKNFSDYYLLQCEKAMENSISQRLQTAIFRVASCWYTAWILAGQPLLPSWNNSQINPFKRTLWSRKNKHYLFPLLEFASPIWENSGIQREDMQSDIDSATHQQTQSADCHAPR